MYLCIRNQEQPPPQPLPRRSPLPEERNTTGKAMPVIPEARKSNLAERHRPDDKPQRLYRKQKTPDYFRHRQPTRQKPLPHPPSVPPLPGDRNLPRRGDRAKRKVMATL